MDGKAIKSGKVRRPAIVKSLREKSTKAMLINKISVLQKPLYGFSMVFFLLLLGSCHSKRHTSEVTGQDSPQGKSLVKYAVGFDLVDFGSYKVLHIFQHNGDYSDTTSYVLAQNEAQIGHGFSGLSRIDVPVKNIALLNSSYISLFDICNSLDHIKAISEAQYVYNDQIFEAVQSDQLPEVGYGETLDKEALLSLGIELVVTVGFPNTPNKSQELLSELGVPVLVLSDWLENNVLGRAEWLKVIAALTASDSLGDARFDEIEKEYNRLKNLISSEVVRPKVVCNLPFKGSWFVPGGNSYMSHLLMDARSDYLWSDDDGTGGLQLDFEAVYAKGIDADFWINPGFSHDIKDIIATDERLQDFHAVASGQVYNSNNRMARGLANDYWESGITHPQIILADFIKIFHPDLLPDHELYYFQKLK